MTAIAESSSSPTVDADVPCVGCRYNLRTLAISGSCPECGASVERSCNAFYLDSEELGKLRENGLPWMRAMRTGLTTSLATWIASAACLTLPFIFGTLFGTIEPARFAFGQVIWLIPYVSIFVIAHLSAWQLMTPRRRRLVLALNRIVLVLSLLALGGMFVNISWDNTYRAVFGTLPPNWLLDRVEWTGQVLSVAWPIAIATTFGRFVQIAQLAQSRAASVAFAVYGVLVACFSAFIAAGLALGYEGARLDSDFIRALPGPTGCVPGLWAESVPWIWRALERVSHGNFNRLLEPALMLLMLIASLTQGIAIHLVRRRLTRAIRLSESPAANSPPSPSPHHPR